MLANGMALLLNYLTLVLPGLALCVLWFCLTPRQMPGLRIACLLFAFVIIRDAMTPAGLWMPGADLRIGFVDNPLVLVTLGGLGLGLVALLRFGVADLWSWVVMYKGSSALPGVLIGLAVGAAIGLPIRLVADIELAPASWLVPMMVLAFGGNALEEVLFRGLLQGYAEQYCTPLRAALLSALAFAACHSFLALNVPQAGAQILLFTLIEGLACALLRLRYGVAAAIAAHGTAIVLIAQPL